MKKNERKTLFLGCVFTIAFIVWTLLIQTVDVQPTGQNGTDIGFASLNHWFHKLTGVNMLLYTITDWMGLVPLFVCVIFAGMGFGQLVRRKSLFKVDADIIALGFYYAVVICCYLLFEVIPINYRPILIDGFLEASYPSSTTLLVVTVMPTLIEQTLRRMNKNVISKVIAVCSVIFSVFMVIGRLISGVHWLTDIVGSILLCIGLFLTYRGLVQFFFSKKEK